MPSHHETKGPAETEAVGANLAKRLVPGDVVLVEGELGAGKTTLVRGACLELGVSTPVTSPTFTIGQRYSAPVPVAHVDLYRIAHFEQEEAELLDDYLGPDLITFVEWPQEAAIAAPVTTQVRIEHAGGDRRIISVQ